MTPLRVTSLVAQRVKHLPARQETSVLSLGSEDPLEKEMATHSSILAWRIRWTEEPVRLQSTGLQRVRHDWATSLRVIGFPGGTVVLNCPTNEGDARDVDSIPGLGRSPGEGKSNPLQYFLPGKLHGQMSLVGYSSTKGHKNSDTTKHAHAHT